MKPIKRYLLSTVMVCTAAATYAQRGEIESQTYEILKEKSIEFPKADRLLDKVQPAAAKTEQSKVNYRFNDVKMAPGSPTIVPSVAVSSDEKERKELPEPLNNYIKLGAGNFSRFLGEAFISSRTSEDMVATGEIKHLSAGTGPVDGKNSANSNSLFRVGAKYLGASFKLDGGIEYERKNYYFYGYQKQPEGVSVDRDSIRQTLNRFGVKLGLENTEPNSLIDYKVVTMLNTIKDRYSSSEVDWGTNLQTSLPVTEKIYAIFDADAYVSQRVDLDKTYNRNMFRVKPSFKYADELFSLTVGLNVVNETDNGLDVNRTRAFPVVDLDVAPFQGLHIKAGYNGDIVRNTLRSFLSENQWLGPNLLVANTIKNSDIYAGIKGEGNGLNYEAKVAFTGYKNFYFFNNSLSDTSKFSAIYDSGKTNVLTISGEAGYQVNDLFNTSVKASFNDYSVTNIEEPWHRPKFNFSWFNALTISKKLFITSELYTLSGMKGVNFRTGEVRKLKAIADLNLKIDYLLTRNFSAFVNINNIFGKEYERYMNYRQQGLNFVGGLSFSF
ncbi:TonB-dependent receptor [Ravibacter arvi]